MENVISESEIVSLNNYLPKKKRLSMHKDELKELKNKNWTTILK
jgi:hypothetical protein